MQPTDQLKAEHRAIERMLSVLECVCNDIEAGKPIDPEHLVQMLTFFTEFADRFHHAKEEDLLFPELVLAGLPADDAPLAPFLDEHIAGRGHIGRMRAAIVEYRAGDSAAAATIVANGRTYIDLLRDHIKKEDQMLFPIADSRLAADQQARLARGFAAVERDHPNRHAALLALLDQLEQTYSSAPIQEGR